MGLLLKTAIVSNSETKQLVILALEGEGQGCKPIKSFPSPDVSPELRVCREGGVEGGRGWGGGRFAPLCVCVCVVVVVACMAQRSGSLELL